jgi:hypothetical protein
MKKFPYFLLFLLEIIRISTNLQLSCIRLAKANHKLNVHMNYIFLYEIWKLGKNLEWAVLEDAWI